MHSEESVKEIVESNMLDYSFSLVNAVNQGYTVLDLSTRYCPRSSLGLYTCRLYKDTDNDTNNDRIPMVDKNEQSFTQPEPTEKHRRKKLY